MEEVVDLRILYHSAAPTTKTGYGRGTREIATRLHNEGHEVAVQTLSTVSNEPIWWHGEEMDRDLRSPMKLYPSTKPLGLSDAKRHYNDWEADFYLTHFDTWLEAARNKIPDMEVPYASYVIVDHLPVPNAVVKQVSNAYETVAMSQYGKRALSDKGVRASYIPHGVNPDYFRPLDDPPESIKIMSSSGQREVDLNETFVVGIVAANHGSRKHIPEQMQAFKMFLDKVDKDALLYVHTKQNAAAGFNLSEVQEEIPDTNISVPSLEDYHGVGDEMLNQWYNAFDVLLNCSRGESWGFTITEAQAAGTPCIVTNFSSMPEQLGITPEDAKWHDWTRDGQGAPGNNWDTAGHGMLVDPIIGTFKEKVSARQFICHPKDILGALEYVYYNEAEREEAGKMAAQYVRDNYTWRDHVAPEFDRLMRQFEEERL